MKVSPWVVCYCISYRLPTGLYILHIIKIILQRKYAAINDSSTQEFLYMNMCSAKWLPRAPMTVMHLDQLFGVLFKAFDLCPNTGADIITPNVSAMFRIYGICKLLHQLNWESTYTYAYHIIPKLMITNPLE